MRSFAHHDAQENAIQVGLSGQVSWQGSQGSWIMEIVHEWGMFFLNMICLLLEKEPPFQETSYSGSIQEILGSQNWIIYFLKQQSKDWKFI